MSSYYPSFNYMGQNSFNDKNLIVVHFESGDSGECSTFLEMEPIYTEHPYGIKRQIYGAKYSSVAVIRISVMKADGSDFSVAEVRDFLKWTTGARKSSYLDLVSGDEVAVSFLGHITAVYQQKLDARTIGFTIEHTSASPWAYSPQQQINCVNRQQFSMDDNGTLEVAVRDQNNNVIEGAYETMCLDENGVLTNINNTMFYITDGGVLYTKGNAPTITITNLSDDKYSYVYMDTTITSMGCTNITITNQTLGEETVIKNIAVNEEITLSSNQFILSDNGVKIFGNNFNFVWPKLTPGINEIKLSADGRFMVDFTYRYPIKIGDCAIDVSVYNNSLGCCGEQGPTGSKNSISWHDILDLPTTIGGYGITDAYTMGEVNNMLDSVDPTVDDAALNNMLNGTLL